MQVTDVSLAHLADDWCLVKLLADCGLTGAAPCRRRHAADAEALARDQLIGHDPRAVSSLWDRLSAAAMRGGRSLEARASLDLACWDLKALANDEPLWMTLGGSRPRAVAYASLRTAPRASEDESTWFGAMVQSGGFRWGCLVLSGEADVDARRLSQLRDTLAARGGRVELLVDACGAWPGEVVRMLQGLERDFDIACVKGVGKAGDVLGNRRVADSIRAAVCAGGDLAMESAFQSWFHERAANVVELDLQRLGITGAQRVAEAAFGFELPVLLRAAPGNLHAHLAAALPNCMAVEVVRSTLAPDVVTGDVGFEDGRAVVGDRPGLGLRAGRSAAIDDAGSGGA